ncbi:MAG: YjjG family noncanonical pyrimidine nucleotidase [Thermonemataceae bacterium]
MKYQHIIFDLDHTLWDFNKSATETLLELFTEYGLAHFDVTPTQFVETYLQVNGELWKRYNYGEISQQMLREIRFGQVFERMGLSKVQVPSQISQQYSERCPAKPYLIPHALAILQYLQPRYPLHIITNGFSDIQQVKLRESGILHFFEEVVTSCDAACKKPDKRIFEYLLEKLAADPVDCLMIGDNLATDIRGATNIAMEAVYFNPSREVHEETTAYEISCLSELQDIL